MFSLETIRSLNAQAARTARSKKKKPRRVAKAEDVSNIPFLGDACKDFDEKHERVETLFVDMTGWGSTSDPALTLDQMKLKLAKLAEENGGAVLIALEEQGQFQGYLAVWKAAPR